MKQVIRKGTFETNSSSAHAFTFRFHNDEQYELCERKLDKVTDNFDKLKVLIASNDDYMKRDEAKDAFIKVYCELFDKNEMEVNKEIQGIYARRLDCVCCEMFEEGVLSDCCCDLFELMEIRKEKGYSYEELAKVVFLDEITIFYLEAYGLSYCSIKDVLEGKNPYGDFD